MTAPVAPAEEPKTLAANIREMAANDPAILESFGGQDGLNRTLEKIATLDARFESRGGIYFHLGSTPQETAEAFTRIHVDQYRDSGRPSLPSLVAYHLEELGLSHDSPHYKAAILIATRAEVELASSPQYHNTNHYADVTAQVAEFLKRNNELAGKGAPGATRLTVEEMADSITAAVGHDLDHPGGKNSLPGQKPGEFDRYRLEEQSFKAMEPLLKEAGLNEKAIGGIHTMIQTTSPDGPHGILKAVAKLQQEGQPVDWEKIDSKGQYPELRVLAADPKLTARAAILEDSDLGASAFEGVKSNVKMSEGFTDELQERGYNENLKGPNARKGFSDFVVGSGPASAAAQDAVGMNYKEMYEATVPEAARIKILGMGEWKNAQASSSTVLSRFETKGMTEQQIAQSMKVLVDAGFKPELHESATLGQTIQVKGEEALKLHQMREDLISQAKWQLATTDTGLSVHVATKSLGADEIKALTNSLKTQGLMPDTHDSATLGSTIRVKDEAAIAVMKRLRNGASTTPSEYTPRNAVVATDPPPPPASARPPTSPPADQFATVGLPDGPEAQGSSLSDRLLARATTLLMSEKDLNKKLVESARNGDIKGMQKWLDAGANIHYAQDAAVGQAAMNGRVEALEFLKGRGADIHAKGDYALSAAATEGHADAVRYLLKEGLSPQAVIPEAWNLIDARRVQSPDRYGGIVGMLRDPAKAASASTPNPLPAPIGESLQPGRPTGRETAQSDGTPGEQGNVKTPAAPGTTAAEKEGRIGPNPGRISAGVAAFGIVQSVETIHQAYKTGDKVEGVIGGVNLATSSLSATEGILQTTAKAAPIVEQAAPLAEKALPAAENALPLLSRAGRFLPVLNIATVVADGVYQVSKEDTTQHAQERAVATGVNAAVGIGLGTAAATAAETAAVAGVVGTGTAAVVVAAAPVVLTAVAVVAVAKTGDAVIQNKRAWNAVDKKIDENGKAERRDINLHDGDGKPSILRYGHIASALKGVSVGMRDDALSTSLQRDQTGRMKLDQIRTFDMSDPRNIKEFERVLDQKIAEEEKIAQENSSMLPRWLRLSDSVEKEENARVDLAPLKAAKAELDMYKKELADYAATPPAAPAQSKFTAGAGSTARPPAPDQAAGNMAPAAQTTKAHTYRPAGPKP